MRFSALSSLAIALSCLALDPVAAVASAGQGTREGPSVGIWDLPGSGGGGFALGNLFDVQGRAVLFDFQAGLTAAPPVCNVCQEGVVAGVLDDGIGTGADLRADGLYAGVVLFGVGVGSFDLTLSTPTGESVGEMKGVYLDPDASGGSAVGAFVANYEVER